jgi:hypothetical protein
MTMIDNVLGLGMSLGNPTDVSTSLTFNDNYIYGESEIPDCRNPNNPDTCDVTEKFGIYPG